MIAADVGKRVVFFSSQDKREKYGTLRYYGNPEFAEGVWCGVELDRAEGKNNGSKHGIRYFTCEPSYGVFVPGEKVERDSSRRSRSRPSSRPGSRPSSADRGSKSTRTDSSGAAVSQVQQELARLTQPPGAVAERLAKRKAGKSSVTNWRQPLKAFARSKPSQSNCKDNAAVARRTAKAQLAPFSASTSSTIHRAASSENLRALKNKSNTVGNKTVKKSSSERNLSEDNAVSGSKDLYKRSSRPSSVSSATASSEDTSVPRWPRVSTPRGNSKGSPAAQDVSTSSQSSASTSRGSSPIEGNISTANNGFVESPPVLSSSSLPSGLATHASQLVEAEKYSFGNCNVPHPNASHGKLCYQNNPSGTPTLTHPLTHAVGHLETDGLSLPQPVVQILLQLIEQNKQILERQGMVLHLLC